MVRMRSTWVFLGVLLVAFVPVAAAQTAVEKCSQQCRPQDPDVNDSAVREEGVVNVILYGHFQDILNRAPMTPQYPDPVHEPDHNAGYLMPVVDTKTGTLADVHFDNSMINMFPNAGRLEFQPDGAWRINGHASAAAEGLMLGAGEAVVYAYFSAEALPEPQDSRAGAMPQIWFEATWIKEEAGAPRAVVARGATSTFDLINRPGERPVYELRIPLEFETRDLTGCYSSPRCYIQVHPHQVSHEYAEVMQREWRVRTGPDYPWRVVVPIENPIDSRSVEGTRNGDTLFVRWSVYGVLGAYDVDESSMRLRVLDGEGNTLLEPAPLFVKVSNDHDGAFRPVIATWSIPVEDVPVADAYRLELSASNLQGTFVARETVNANPELFERAADAPGFEAVLLLAGLLGLAWVRSRRP